MPSLNNSVPAKAGMWLSSSNIFFSMDRAGTKLMLAQPQEI
jgi:hypothetical protein